VGRRRQRLAESVVLLDGGKRAWRIPFVKRRLSMAASFLGDDTGQTEASLQLLPEVGRIRFPFHGADAVTGRAGVGGAVVGGYTAGGAVVGGAIV
jgi:hypothetical protein